MSFRHPNPCRIESSTGFSVDRVERSTLLYSTANKSASISIEMLVDCDAIFVLYKSSVDFWDDGTPIDPAEQSQILANIRDAFQSKGQEFEIK